MRLPNKLPTRKTLQTNTLAGLSVGAYFIPQAMAYGQLAGIGPAAGLSLAAIPLIIYMILGKNPLLSIGPESAVALMSAAAIATITTTHHIPATTALAITAILTGAILAAGWLLKASFLADLLNKPLLVGYLTGVGILMILSQLPKIAGYPLNTESIITILQSPLHPPVWKETLLALGVCLTIILLHKLSPKTPATLLALIGAILAGAALHTKTIGAVTLTLPSPNFTGITLDLILALTAPAAAIALVAYTDVMVAARAFTNDTRPDPSREMIALAAAQAATGAAGGYPISASTSRTALAKVSGATSKYYSAAVVAVLLLLPLLLPGIIAKIPQAALAGIVLYAAISLIEPTSWKNLYNFRKTEALIAATTAATVVLLGILPGVVLAIILSLIEFLKRLARPHEGELGFVEHIPGLHDVDDRDNTYTIPGLVIFRYDAPLFFLNAYDFYDKALSFIKPETRVLLINVEANTELDYTSLDVLDDLYNTLQQQHIQLWLTRVKTDVLTPMLNHGIGQKIGKDHMFYTLPTAVEHYKQVYVEFKDPNQNPTSLQAEDPDQSP